MKFQFSSWTNTIHLVYSQVRIYLDSDVWTSPNSGFSSLQCFARPFLPLQTQGTHTVPLKAVHTQVITLPPQMMQYAFDHELFQSLSIPFTPSFYRLILISSVQTMLLSKSNQAFLFWSLLSGLHPEVNPLYLLSQSLLFMVDLDNEMPTSWRVFFT